MATWAISIAGCSTIPDRHAAIRNLRRIGLEVQSPRDALLPAEEADRFVACRVLPDVEPAPLAPHPAGYLIVGIGETPAERLEDLWRVLARWQPGTKLRVIVRLNPHASDATEWWESDVEWLLPAKRARPN